MKTIVNYLFQVIYVDNSNDIVNKSVSDAEVGFLRSLIKHVGYEWAVRIEDFLIILNTVILTTIVFMFYIAFLIKAKNKYSIRFSDEMDGFVYLWAERGDIKEVVIKRPQNFIDKIEVIIAFFWIRFFDHIPLRERKAKRISLFIIFLFILMLFTMFVLFLFILNVYHEEQIALILPIVNFT